MSRVATKADEPSKCDQSGPALASHSTDVVVHTDVRRPQCERCAATARVCVLEGYVDGQPFRRHLCLNCSDAAYSLYLANSMGPAQPRPHLSSLLIAAGLLLVILGASADLFIAEGAVGFGWQQQTGLAIGVLLVILGGLLRVDVLALSGSILFAVAALADVYGTVGSVGVGWRQRVVMLAGLVCVFVGLRARKRRLRRYLSATD